MKVAATLLILLAGSSRDIPTSVDHRTFTAIVYADHYENRLGRHDVASHNIFYSSSIDVTMVEYGGRQKHCQFGFSNFALARRFSYDILHQAQPYGVLHIRSGTRNWLRAATPVAGDVRGSCKAALDRQIAPMASGANALGAWKDIIDQDDAVMRALAGSQSVRR